MNDRLYRTTALSNGEPFVIRRLLTNANVVGHGVRGQLMLTKPQGMEPITSDQRRQHGFDLRILKARDGVETALWIKEPQRPNGNTIIYYHGSIGHMTDSGVHPFILEKAAKQLNKPLRELKDLSLASLENLCSVHKIDIPEFSQHARQYRLNQIEEMANQGFRVIAVHSRGFGSSGNTQINKDCSLNTIGKASELGFIRDNAALLEFIRGQNIKPNQVILYGESLGVSRALDMAAQMSAKWEAPRLIAGYEGVSSVKDFLAGGPVLAGRMSAPVLGWAITDNFNAKVAMSHISSGTGCLIMTGNQGDVVGATHATKLYALAVANNLRAHKVQLEGGHFTADAKDIVQEITGCLEKAPAVVRRGTDLPRDGESTRRLR